MVLIIIIIPLLLCMLSHFIVPVYTRANFVIGPRAVKSAR
jgi:hypothetical protein